MLTQEIELFYKILRQIQFDIDGETYTADKGFEHLCDLLRKHRDANSQVFFIGNGGSAGIAQHMTADFLKNGGMRSISLYNQPNLTCLGNDLGYETIFAEQLRRLASPGDLLVAISSSGESPNIIRAIDEMKTQGGEAVTLTGFGANNACRKRGDFNLYVPSDSYGIVESAHNYILQLLVDSL